MTLRALPVLAALLLTCAVGADAAELANRGGFDEFFYDPASGLTWCDPDNLVGPGRPTLEAFVQNNSTGWVWATSGQIDALVGSTAPAGATLEDVMGPRQFTVGANGPRWIGYYAGNSPDGWLIQSEDDPTYATLHTSGGQANVAAWDPGGWFVNPNDPTTQPRLENLGDAGQFFRDQSSNLYWYDPEHFVGMTRAQVATWLTAHPRWRWATANEVRSLVGRLSVGNVSLVEILGAAQYDLGEGQPRWIGYYAQETEPDGLLVEANMDPWRHIMTTFSTQVGVASWDPGAWLVTTSDPTAADGASWGEVKRDYR